MEIARCAKDVTKVDIYDIREGRSNFDLVDRLFKDPRSTTRLQAIRRLFSLARAGNCKTLVVESLLPTGAIEEENEDIGSRYTDAEPGKLWRLSFWHGSFEAEEGLKTYKQRGDLEGFALCKLDIVPSKGWHNWHIYEAVFRKYDHENNCVPVEKAFKVTIGRREFKIKGVLYCQQNSLNKACAQVGLRSLILNATNLEDISYRKIHELAVDGGQDFDPGGGLSADRIQKVLRGLSIPFEDMDYSVLNDPDVDNLIQEICAAFEDEGHLLSELDEKHLQQLISTEAERSLENAQAPLRSDSYKLSWNCINPFMKGHSSQLKAKVKSIISKYQISHANFRLRAPLSMLREQYPYHKYLYAGVESGGGALLGFDLAVPVGEPGGRHIVPVYGHTFNKDTWVPNATNAYFRVGKDTKYVSSSNWLSSFLMHDDNFGPNYCLPRSYVLPEQVSYVLAILRDSAKYGGLTAEAMGIDLLYTIGGHILDPSESWHNSWHQRLLESIPREEVVLRAICLTRDEYVQHLRGIKDWEGKTEFKELPELLKKSLPKLVWMVEFSVPELFPTNLSKLGELLFDATVEPDENRKPDYGVFLLSRFPGVYVLKLIGRSGKVPLGFYRSKMKSHTKVFVFDV